MSNNYRSNPYRPLPKPNLVEIALYHLRSRIWVRKLMGGHWERLCHGTRLTSIDPFRLVDWGAWKQTGGCSQPDKHMILIDGYLVGDRQCEDHGPLLFERF